MYAVIKTGGKQYKVSEGDKLIIEKIEGEAGDVVAFDQVLMLGGEDGLTVGSPMVAGASVMGELVDIRKGKKIKVFKKRRRQNYRRTKGHRQWEVLVSISEIVVPGAKAKTKASAKPKPAVADAAAPAAKPAASKPAKAKAAAHDDLTQLNGVGPALATKLADAGVTSFAQVAAWTAADLESLDATISGLKAKAEKGDWINAAKDLAGK